MSSIAFFDFDETIVPMKSMFFFLKYATSAKPRMFPKSYEAIMASIHQLSADGTSREGINTYYYSIFAGIAVNEVRFLAKSMWLNARDYLITVSVERLREHQRLGDDVVVVSGAMRDIIDPVLEQIDVDQTLCSEPEVINGRYTGGLTQQAIGVGKAKLVTAYCEDNGITPLKCYAYGDHVSDLDMLMAVGFPVAVNPDPALLSIAREKSWPVLSSDDLSHLCE
ncbi:HAD family hydrolase [Methylobacterium radiotolerans]|uniref:HAD family hydrolase n=1 Tax=Methylobacterium radiotolerans TaxID=31998 RepID=UPI000975C393|nr:HAD-IB family hydrolase [Methylobacterium radiotolerans]